MNRDSVKSAAATELHEATTANTIATEGRVFVLVVRTSSSLATMIDNTIQYQYIATVKYWASR